MPDPTDPANAPHGGLVTVQKAAQLLSVSTRQIYNLVGQGRLRSFKLGRARRISRESLDAYVASCADHPARPIAVPGRSDV